MSFVRARLGPLLATTGLLAALAGAAAAATVTGVVVDRKGQPLEFANVTVPALKRGAVTDGDGRFTLELPEGPATLVVSQIGYTVARLAVTAGGAAAPLRVTLDEEPVPVAEVNVSASSFGKTGKSEGAVVRRMDVYMTPGGAGDVFQALRALPGINAPAEGAALYVRGGDPDETVIRVDGAEIGHPYHYEGASGGLFSILDTYMLKSAFFSSGGFTAKYGGAMSGVLDIETQDPMNLRTVNLSANLAGGGFSSTWALVPDRLSALVSVQRSVPELLFRLYGSESDYTQPPWSENGIAKLLWRYSPTGRASVFGIASTEHLGLYADALNVRHEYTSNAKNAFGALHVKDVLFGRAALRASVTNQHYRSGWGFAEFGGRDREHNTQATADVVWPLGKRHELSFGGAWRREARERTGVAAADSVDLASGAPLRPFGTRAVERAPGFYAEDKLRVWGPLYATAGVRADWSATEARWLADPRAALAWRVDEHQTVRLAGGRYHQPADPTLLDQRYGNPDLRAPFADHLIAGWEWKSDFGNVRLEGYQKRYERLPVVDSLSWYRAAGTGLARGVDVFVQGTWKDLNGWVSYGWIDAKRRVLDDPREVPASGAVKNALTVVGQYAYSMRWQGGLRWTHTSGRPYTPVTGAVWEPARRIWRPVYAENNSGLMPAYDRLDVRLMRLFSLPGSGRLPASSVCVAYVEAMNVLGTKNVLDYVYDFDYSHRYEDYSYFSRRLLVAGVSLTW